MKYFILLLLSITFSTTLAQKMPSDYFDEASKYFEEENFDKALKSYQYIVDNHLNNELYPRAFYNVGYIHFFQENYEQAVPIFKSILEGDFNEKEDLGGSIMADPYTNYRHRASKILSAIYYNQENYDSSLYYFSLSDTKYPYLHFCGNEYDMNRIYTALHYSDIYQKLGQPNKAIEKLLQNIFIGFADNSQIMEELKKLLAGKKNLKKKLDKSLKNIYPKTIKTEDSEYTIYCFKFLDTEITVPSNYKELQDEIIFNKKETIQQIKQTDFYKMIVEI